MAALGMVTNVEGTVICADVQRDYILRNTPRLSRDDVIQVYHIPCSLGYQDRFKTQTQGSLAVNIDRIPDEIINQMYILIVNILSKKSVV